MTQTPLPTRFSRNPNREQWARKLVDGHKIGLVIDDPDVRDEPRSKISNYGMVAPYGGKGTSLFVHGKVLFETKEAADAFYAGDHDPRYFNPRVIQHVAQIYLPESLDARIANYMVKDAAPESRLAFKVAMFQKLYPKIDFSVLPFVNENNVKHVQQGLNYILGSHHITKEKATQQLEHYMMFYDRSNYADVIKGYMQDEVQRDYFVYMADEPHNDTEAKAKQEWGETLQDYLKDHDWDWEILENFKVAARTSLPAHTTCDAFLKTGAELRARSDVLALAVSLHHPYDPVFDEVERTMAAVTTDAVQPAVIDYIARTHSALLFTDASDIDMFKQVSMFVDTNTEHAVGIHIPSADGLSTSVVGFSEIHKPHHDLVGTICHEIEHKLDLDAKKSFAEKYKTRLPAMIREDAEHFATVEAYIRGVDSSMPEAAHELRVLGKKRGLRIDVEDVETLKQGLLLDMEDMKERLGVFASKYKKHALFSYDRTLKNIEIPAIMEELKGAYGRKFIEALLPQLALATENHRKMQLYGKQALSREYMR